MDHKPVTVTHNEPEAQLRKSGWAAMVFYRIYDILRSICSRISIQTKGILNIFCKANL